VIKHSSVIFLVLVASLWSAAAVSDPMRPPGFGPQAIEKKAVKARVNFRLQQIQVRQGVASAIVNGQLVKVGDTLSGARVLDITPEKVVIKYGRNVKTLSLLKGTKHAQK